MEPDLNRKSRGIVVEKKTKKKKNFIHYVLYAAGLVVALTVVLMTGIGYIMLQPLPDVSMEAIERRSSRPSTIFANDGSVIAQWHGDTERLPLHADEFPQIVFDATVAIEDQRFFDHSGLDVRAIMRAVQRNMQAGEVVEGGSTITQQLMKMMYVGDDQSMLRKIEEAILASRLEMERDKDDILAAYLNMSFFGQGAYGLAAAADIYFGVEPYELTAAQAATLAGILHMPSAYRPHEDLRPLEQRRDLVLREMRDQRFITPAEYYEAKEEVLKIEPRVSNVSDVRFPFFVDLVQRELLNVLDEERIAQGGLNIFTTLDPAVQEAAEEVAATFNSEAEGPTVSMVTMRHSDGAILALIGGKDWDESEFNLAVQARRQPGSAFKPLTLITAMEEGIDADHRMDATSFEVEVRDEMWNVTNYGGATPSSPMSLRAATVSSINTVYARLIMEVGPQRVANLAHELGFEAEMEPDPALSLGGLRYGVSPLEMARAYTTMAKDGVDIEPQVIARISTKNSVDSVDDANEEEPEILYQMSPDPHEQRVYSEETGRELRTILRESVTQGTGMRADISGVQVSGKTGTTQNYHDAWFVGWAEGVTTAVWMGFPEAQIEMRDIRGRDVTGGSYPAQIFHDFMVNAIEVRPGVGMPYVPGVTGVSEDDLPFGHEDIPTLEEVEEILSRQAQPEED
ncbi:MAG: penicillin-binding protein [Coriobacteriia bacterium]|nr:penicillin-binding protein [Coriobacteriia bacterium]